MWFGVFLFSCVYLFISTAGILTRLKAELQYHPLPIAQAELVMEQLEPNTSTGTRSIPFIHVSMSTGIYCLVLCTFTECHYGPVGV